MCQEFGDFLWYRVRPVWVGRQGPNAFWAKACNRADLELNIDAKQDIVDRKESMRI